MFCCKGLEPRVATGALRTLDFDSGVWNVRVELEGSFHLWIYFLGGRSSLVLLGLVVQLWTCASLLVQQLLLTSFPRPFCSTLLQSACPALLLLPGVLVVALRKWV